MNNYGATITEIYVVDNYTYVYKLSNGKTIEYKVPEDSGGFVEISRQFWKNLA